MTQTAADLFTTAAADIARNLIANGATVEAAGNVAIDYLLTQMANERPELLAKVILTSPLAR